jgi:hypothetical protein
MLESWDPNQIHRIRRAEIEHVLKCLRFLDRAKKQVATIEGGQEIAADIRASIDGIYTVLKALPKE